MPRSHYSLSVTRRPFLSLALPFWWLSVCSILLSGSIAGVAGFAASAAPRPSSPEYCSSHAADYAALPFDGPIPSAGLCIDASSLGGVASDYQVIYVIEREQNVTLEHLRKAASDPNRESDSGHHGFGIEIIDAGELPVLITASNRHGTVSVAGIKSSHAWSQSLTALSSILKRTTGPGGSEHTAADLAAPLANIEFELLNDELRGRARTILANAALTRTDFTNAENWAASRIDNDPMSDRWLGIVAFEAAAALGSKTLARAALCRALASQTTCEVGRASSDSLLAGIAANRLGLMAHRAGQLNEARRWYIEAIELYADRYPRGAAVANQNIGGIASTRGNFSAAEKHFSMSAELYRKHGWHAPLSSTLRNLAAANSSRGDFGRASENLRNSLRAAEEAHQPRSQAETLIHLAELMRRLGRLIEAEGYSSQARALLGDRNLLRQKASWAIVSGRIAQARGDTSTAITRLDEALTGYQSLGITWSIVSTQLAIARAYNDYPDAVAAQVHANAALTLARQHGYARHESEALLLSGIAARLEGKSQLSRTLLTQTLALKNDTLDLLGGFEVRLELAELAYRQAERAEAIQWLEEARPLADAAAKTIARADDRAFFANNLRRADRLHIRALLTSEQPKAALNLVLSRYGRAALLSDNEGETSISPDLRDAIARQAAQLHRTRTPNSAGQNDPELTSQIRRLLLEVSSQREKQAAVMPSANELMSALPDNSVYLHLVPDTESSHLWIVRKDGVSYRSLPDAGTINASISQLREATAKRADVNEQREYLSRALLPELNAEEVIYVAAEGEFSGLPFAMLGTKRYLIEEHRIIALTNAALLTTPRPATKPHGPEMQVTVFADPVFGGMDMRLPVNTSRASNTDGPLPRLPFTTLEANAISRLSPQAQVFTGFDATREALLDPGLASQDVLHIAAHGLLDEQLPEASGLYLAAVTEMGEPRNALVTLVDLYQTRFPQQLIVLSACDTAAGTQLAGESGLSLARAFLRQGSRQVIATQWPVADATSARLFEHFYDSLLVNRQPVSHSLRAAQLSILRNPRTRHPYFWAGYALAGPD